MTQQPKRPKKSTTKVSKVENESALKHLYDQKLLRRISQNIEAVYPGFDGKKLRGLMPELQVLEMKDRVRLIRDHLYARLPEDFPKALRILLASMRRGELSGFDLWPYAEFIQTYGLEHLEISLDALKEVTKRFTSEWAVRPFLVRYPDETLRYLERCANDKDVSVRRWASEGTRPRLPWGQRLHAFIKDPAATANILEILKFDPELFVRKSVANHLNDIAKDHPAFVVKLLKSWSAAAGEEHLKNINWITRHALRSLIKAGHQDALELMGVPNEKDTKIRLAGFKLQKKRVMFGDSMTFEFVIQSQSTKQQKLVVDYVIHFVKANQKRAPKVFKLKTLELGPKEEARFNKSHHLKPITTRQYYSGIHLLEVQVNGKVLERIEWHLSI